MTETGTPRPALTVELQTPLTEVQKAELLNALPWTGQRRLLLCRVFYEVESLRTALTAAEAELTRRPYENETHRQHALRLVDERQAQVLRAATGSET